MKKARKTNKKVEESESEDIELYESENDSELGEEQHFVEEEEDIDDRRIKLAKRLIETTKKSLNDTLKRTKETTNFFIEGEELINQHTIQKLQDDEMEKKKKKKYYHMDSILKFRKTKGALPYQTLKGHKRPITAVCFCPKTNDVYSVAKDGAILVFRKELGYKRFLFCDSVDKNPEGHADELLAIDISFDSKYLITAGKDKVIKLWDVETQSLLHTFTGHRAAINCLKFRMLSHEFLSGSSDRSLRYWDAEQKGLIQNLYGHQSCMLALSALSTEALVSVSFDKTPVVWKLEKEKQMMFKEQPFSLDCVSAIGTHSFVTGGQDGRICMWNLAKKGPRVSLENAHEGGWVSAVSCCYNGDFVVSGAMDGYLKLYRASHETLKEMDLTFEFEEKCEGIISGLTLSNDNKHIAVSIGSEDRLGRWNFKKGIKSEIRVYQLFD